MSSSCTFYFFHAHTHTHKQLRYLSNSMQKNAQFRNKIIRLKSKDNHIICDYLKS